MFIAWQYLSRDSCGICENCTHGNIADDKVNLSQMRTDSLFYRLFQRMPELVLTIAGLDVPAEGYCFQSVEIKQTAFRLDGILWPPEGDARRPRIYVEVQFRADEGFYPRFFSEIFLHLRQHPTPGPWLAVVIYPERSVERAGASSFRSLLQLPEVQRVYLEDFSAAQGQGALGLIGLIVCPAEAAAAQAQRMAAQVSPPLPWEEWLDFIETILVYKLPHLSREEIKQMIGIQDIELKQTRFYQDVFSEGRLEGRLEGKLEGRLEGKLEGKLEGEAALLERQLSKRFGPLSEEVRRRIAQATSQQLETWGENVLDAQTLSAVFEGH